VAARVLLTQLNVQLVTCVTCLNSQKRERHALVDSSVKLDLREMSHFILAC
jgi:hypothetical protein